MSRPTLQSLTAFDVRPAARAREAFDLESRGVVLSVSPPEGGRLTVGVGSARLEVGLVSTPCRYGGARWWASCPRCGRRCAILYLQANLFRSLAGALLGDPDAGWYLACRVCVGRPYASQGWGALQTLYERARRAEERATPGGDFAPPPRRWRRTQARLDRAAFDASDRALRRAASWLGV